MSSARVSLVALAMFGLVALGQAAGGIKGGLVQQGSIKSPFARFQQQQQQQYNLPPPPPPQVLLPAPQQFLPPPPPPQQPIVQQVAIKGPGQVTPVFSAARVAPAPQPIVVQQQEQPFIQQQQLVQVQEQEPEPVQQQQQPVVQQQIQQQQQQEIDPSADAQDASPAIAAPARQAPVAAAQGTSSLAVAGSEEEANPRPEPYAFQYAFDSGDSATSGSSQREEQQDANGRVTGFYTLKGEDGRDRRVDYVADASGFRATISTNEMGTAPKDSADVDWNAQSPSDAQLRIAESATQAARQRALANPQQQQQVQQQPIASGSGVQQKFSSPRQNVAASAFRQQKLSKTNFQPQQQAQQQERQQQQQQITQQLQEPFEQIRQVELNARARKSRHAPFYLFTY